LAHNAKIHLSVIQTLVRFGIVDKLYDLGFRSLNGF
jgi:hypothetical protein